MIGCIACLAFFCLSKCSNELEVQREYAYEVSTWPLPAEVAPGEEVEIRFTLEREGDYAGAEYGFSWVQTDGKGTLRDSRGMYYTDREEYELRVVPDLDVSDPALYALVPADGQRRPLPALYRNRQLRAAPGGGVFFSARGVGRYRIKRNL